MQRKCWQLGALYLPLQLLFLRFSAHPLRCHHSCCRCPSPRGPHSCCRCPSPRSSHPCCLCLSPRSSHPCCLCPSPRGSYSCCLCLSPRGPHSRRKSPSVPRRHTPPAGWRQARTPMPTNTRELLSFSGFFSLHFRHKLPIRHKSFTYSLLFNFDKVYHYKLL